MKRFLPQSTLESWAMEEKADLQDGELVMTGDAVRYPAEPAVHILRVASGTDDARLLEKVKTQRQLEALGAEQMAESLLLGETAYDIVPGYVAVTADPAPSATEPDAAMLADFLLTKRT